MIERTKHIDNVNKLLERSPVVAITGARQVGKTTLARVILNSWKEKGPFFDLENPIDLARLEDPMIALGDKKGLVVIDEIQQKPELFPVLRVLADKAQKDTRYLILGSASSELTGKSAESLAGRISYHHLRGFTPDEVGLENIERLWIRGGFPKSYLADTDDAGASWLGDFTATYLERDLPRYGVRVPSITIRRFWTMLAHYHGQIWNGSEFARAFGVSTSAIRRYLDILASTFVVRVLSPWWENMGKRLVKAPKVFISDSGLLHSLLGIGTMRALEGHPKVGASWEGFAMESVISLLGARDEECYFWAAHSGAEVDLLVVRGEKKMGFEFKRSSAPKTTRSMHTAVDDLKLEKLFLVHAGEDTYPLAEKILAVSLRNAYREIPQL